MFGDTVAMVVANSHDEAKDAAESIKVDYDVKSANVDLAKALDKGAVEVHAEAPGNLVYDWEIGVKADVDAAFAKAAHVTKLDTDKQPADPQRHGAAGRGQPNTTRARATIRCGRRRRIRTCCG